MNFRRNTTEEGILYNENLPRMSELHTYLKYHNSYSFIAYEFQTKYN
jgi:hypothetical protein